MKCSCDGEMVERTVRDYDVSHLVGLKRVVLTNARALVCRTCNEVSLDGAIIEFTTDALAEVLATSDGALHHDEVRFLRIGLMLTQQQLADRLGVTRETVSRWESGVVKIDGTAAVALRGLVMMDLIERKEVNAAELAKKFTRPRHLSPPPFPLGDFANYSPVMATI